MNRILFVCLGNICRSPLAEAAMRAEADRRGIVVTVDSAGTGDWHVGRPPDRRAIATAAAHGLDIAGRKGRQIASGDFTRFDHIVALDRSNLRNIEAMRPHGATAYVSLLLDHAPGHAGEDVADPYFGEIEGFETCWTDIRAGVIGLLDTIAPADSVR
jgi:protein-tyrosine phosphatase